MTTSFIQDHIPRRMAELGFAKCYRTTMRTVNLPPGGSLTIRAWNQWLYFPLDLLSTAWAIEIESNFGYFNRSGSHREQAYEHTGKVVLTNSVLFATSVSYFEVTPTHPHDH